LAAHGCDVLCVDRDIDRLRHLEMTKDALLRTSPVRRCVGRVATLCANVSTAKWPFSPTSFDLIIVVHLPFTNLLPALYFSLRTGGHLFLETFGGHGGNYVDLPAMGEIRAALKGNYDIIYYSEKPASRRHSESVSLKAVARKIAVGEKHEQSTASTSVFGSHT
jgi:hypothetical protein